MLKRLLSFTLITDLKRSSPLTQQSLARVLGCFDYLSHNNGLGPALACLLDVVDPSVRVSNIMRSF